jgi:hypothetical protein
MSVKTETVFTDDLTGAEGAKRVEFTHNGTEYTVDLSPLSASNFLRMQKAYTEKMEKFLAVAVPVKRQRKSSKSTTAPTGEAALIRAWAVENGVEVGKRGRIHPDVKAAYAAAKSV